MSGSFLVRGGKRLSGSVRVSGSKNAVLPILAASLLTDGEVSLENCPKLTDVDNMLRILQHLGCETDLDGGSVVINASGASLWEMPEHLSRELRSSIFLLGPILGRFGRALFTYPGGCEIGQRPIDFHLKGLRVLNAGIEETHGFIVCKPSKLTGATVNLDYPSVGATENIMMAAVKAEGRTVIHNAAMEPEIVSLQDFINAMGGNVSGAGTPTITIEGVRRLHSAQFTVPPDRIVAGTYLAAAAIAGGEAEIADVQAECLMQVLSKLRDAGCEIRHGFRSVSVKRTGRPNALRLIETLPYPGFPTDMQAQFFALAAISRGTTMIVENVFENRFRHAQELVKMGADVTVRDRMAIVHGVEKLTGAAVAAWDLRGGAALVLAGLAAEGATRVDGAHYIDRGYEALDRDLSLLGADIERV
jgi:UDP-N-acetylglucosamine 1-carboxyvinyltransferase